MTKLLIIDTYGLIFRAFHAYPLLTTADGKPTNAIYGVLQMLLSSLEKINPTHIICSLESSTPTFRHKLAHDYKAHRKEPAPELSAQIEDVISMLQTLGIPLLQKDGFEADDVIGAFAKQHENDYDEIKIITGDRDLLQLLSPKIAILMPGRFFSDLIAYDREKFKEKFEIELEDYVLYKSIIGDASDNIKGIPGIGPKTAIKIVNQFHSIDSILANLDEFPPKIAEKFLEHQDLWRNYYQLCEIDTKINGLNIAPADTAIERLNIYKLRAIVEKYEFQSMQKHIARFIDNFEKKYGFGLFNTGEMSKDIKDELHYATFEKVSFKPIQELKGNEAFIIPTGKDIRIGNGEDFCDIETSELFNFVINNSLKRFIGFDLKHFIKLLLDSGIEHIEKYDFVDLKLAWYLIRSDKVLENINDLVKYLDEENYISLYLKTLDEIEKSELSALFDIEKDLETVIASMEYSGIKVNTEHLIRLQKKYSDKIAEIKKQMFDFVGFEFNPASTRDLGHVLFDVLKLPVYKKNKTGYSTDDQTLTFLEGTSEIIPFIKQFRMYAKTLSTYVTGYLETVAPDSKVHTTFNQTLVATGRLSSTNPNMQNLPAGEEIGKDIKSAFIVSDGNKIFLSFDYSQIDLRVLAYESKDPALLTAFQNKEDIHTTTAKVIFEKEEISRQERRFAKTINFGIVYGMEPYGLSQALKIDQKSAKEFIEKYLERFIGVQKYFDRIRRELDEKGYVQTFLGRRRYFPAWKSAAGFQKRLLFREAINMPIQGGTSELIKIAMVKLFCWIKEHNIKSSMLLQIHDELVLEIDKSEDIEAFKKKGIELMSTAYDFGIPVEVSVKEGKDLTFV